MQTVNEFDIQVIRRINDYIIENGLSVSKIAKEVKMDYKKLWSLLNRNGSIKLNDYVNLCTAFKEPFEKFLVD